MLLANACDPDAVRRLRERHKCLGVVPAPPPRGAAAEVAAARDREGHDAGSGLALDDVYFDSRGEGFGAEVKRRIMIGTFALSKGYGERYYVNALKVRRLIKQDFDAAFERCDVILSPTAPTPAFKIGEKSGDPLDDDRLAGHERAARPGQEHGSASDFIGFADATQGIHLDHLCVNLRVFPQSLGEISADQAGRDAIGANVLRPPLRAEIASERHVRRHRVAPQPRLCTNSESR